MEKGRAQYKKRLFPYLEESQNLKKSSHSFPTDFGAQSSICYKELALVLKNLISCPKVREEVEKKVEELISLSQPNNLTKEEDAAGSGTSKYKLCFLNQIPSSIFTNNDLEAQNGEPLQLAICDVTNFNTIIRMGPLSSAQIEFVVLDGEFGSGRKKEEVHWSVTDFNTSVLSQRDGKRPLLVGKDLNLGMKNGVAVIKNLFFTDNSSWLKSKKFRLGARIVDEKNLGEFTRIGEAVSQPFRVKDHRGEVNKKHHPPRGEDEVWRLDGIGKNGVYHKNLSSNDIQTVDDFLNVHFEKGEVFLRKLLGKRVPDRVWNAMVKNASERFSINDSNPNGFQMQDLVGNEEMRVEAFEENNAEVGEQKINLSDGDELHQILSGFGQELESMLDFGGIIATD